MKGFYLLLYSIALNIPLHFQHQIILAPIKMFQLFTITTLCATSLQKKLCLHFTFSLQFLHMNFLDQIVWYTYSRILYCKAYFSWCVALEFVVKFKDFAIICFPFNSMDLTISVLHQFKRFSLFCVSSLLFLSFMDSLYYFNIYLFYFSKLIFIL